MSQYIEVTLLNKPLGVLAWNREKNEGQFEFLPGFVNNIQDISPINYSKVSLGNNADVLKFNTLKDVPQFFKDIFPGDFANRLLRYALQKSGKTPESLSPLSIFSLTGNRGIGAFGFEPYGYPELDETESVEIDRMVRSLHQMFQTGSKDISEKRLRELLRCGLFSTSADPEIFLAINDYNGEVLSGQGIIPSGYDAWKLKLDGLFPSSTLNINNEYSNCRKAIECGIEMVKYRLLKEGVHSHLLISRIDRVKGEKIHFQSFISLRDDQSNTYEAVFRCMRQLRLQYPEFIQMFKRMVFNILIGNTLETGKNFLFTCLNKNEWHLAPASGLIPTPWIKSHSLSVCGKTNNITTEDLIKFGELQNIRKCCSIVKKIEDVIQF